MLDDYPCPAIETSYENEIDLNKLPFIENEVKGRNNILYNIKIYNAKNSIIFNIKKYNDFLVINYQNEYTFEQLNKIDIFFKSFKSIEEIYTVFFKNFNKKELNILENEKNLNLIIKFDYLGNMKNIKFNFDVYNLNMETTILKLCDKLKEMDKFNINIKETNKEIEENLEENNQKIIEQQQIIENNEKKIDGKIKKIKEKMKNKDMIYKYYKLKEEIKIFEENFDKKLKDNQDEIYENNIYEMDNYKNQLEEKGKKIIIINNIVIAGIILLILLFINLKLNYKINKLDKKCKNQIIDIDNKFKNSIKGIYNKYDYKINNIDNKNDYRTNKNKDKISDIENKINDIESKINDSDKYDYFNNKINDISNKINLLENNYNKDLFTHCLSKVEPITEKYVEKFEELDFQKDSKNNVLENKINNTDNTVRYISLNYKYY